MGIMKVHYVEFCEEFGFNTRINSKNTIHNLFAFFKNFNYKKITQYLMCTFKISVKGRESILVIIPNHKPLKGALLS